MQSGWESKRSLDIRVAAVTTVGVNYQPALSDKTHQTQGPRTFLCISEYLRV